MIFFEIFEFKNWKKSSTLFGYFCAILRVKYLNKYSTKIFENYYAICLDKGLWIDVFYNLAALTFFVILAVKIRKNRRNMRLNVSKSFQLG